MLKLLKKFNYLIFGGVLLFTSLCPNQDAYARLMKEAQILHGNCDPDADPLQDYRKEENYEKSCVGQEITADKFVVTLNYDADGSSTPGDEMPETYQYLFGTLLAGGVIGGAGAGKAAGKTSVPDPDAEGPATRDGEGPKKRVSRIGAKLGAKAGFLAAGATAMALSTWGNFVNDDNIQIPLGGEATRWMTEFNAVREGDKVCVYAHFMALLNFTVNRSSNVIDPEPTNYKNNCLRLPEYKINLIKPVWSRFISPTCTDYDNSASQFEYVDPKTAHRTGRSFTGVVVQCIEETMMNLFYNNDANAGTIFSIMQDKLKNAIRGLLALYVIFFGYQLMVEKRTFKQSESLWLGLKMALVLYFAAGPGMIDLLPKLQSVSKGLSLIVMEAAAGNPGDMTSASNSLETVTENYSAASRGLAEARYKVAGLQQKMSLTPPAATQAEVDDAQLVVADKLAAYHIVLESYNRALSATQSFGYRYCDFRDFPDSAYMTGDKDNRYMRLWDMIDCKIAKYLGVGENPDDMRAPQVLLIAISCLYWPIIFILVFVFVSFVILIAVRVVHIYIIASMALIILVYISPLIIPAVLFNFTKGVYDMWFKQIISYTLQPVILFIFLAFMFAAMDMFMFGANNRFVPMTAAHNINENQLCMKDTSKNDAIICTSEQFDKYQEKDSVSKGYDWKDLKCNEEEAVGCIYRKTVVGSHNFILGLKIYTSNIADNGKVMPLTLGLLKLVLVCYFAYSIIAFVEGLSMTLTNAVGSAAGMSAAPKPSPHGIAAGGVAMTKGAANLAKTVGRMTGANAMLGQAAGAVKGGTIKGGGAAGRGAGGVAGAFGKGALGIAYQGIKGIATGRDLTAKGARERLGNNMSNTKNTSKGAMSAAASAISSKAGAIASTADKVLPGGSYRNAVRDIKSEMKSDPASAAKKAQELMAQTAAKRAGTTERKSSKIVPSNNSENGDSSDKN